MDLTQAVRLRPCQHLLGGQQRAAAVLIEDLAGLRVHVDLAEAAIGAAHVGFPQAIIAFDLVDLGVTGLAQGLFDLGHAQRRGLCGRCDGQRSKGGEGEGLQHGGSPVRVRVRGRTIPATPRCMPRLTAP
uniref:Uncharacterized protein n=1 Tax=Panagrolaimus superbus TaxID=310955 RepID=A0A914YJR4_9BILA